MKKIIFITEVTKTGFSAFAKDYPVYTTGANLFELKINTLDAINSWFEYKGMEEVSESVIELQSFVHE